MVDRWGRTAVDYAIDLFGNPLTARYLIGKGAKRGSQLRPQ